MSKKISILLSIFMYTFASCMQYNKLQLKIEPLIPYEIIDKIMSLLSCQDSGYTALRLYRKMPLNIDQAREVVMLICQKILKYANNVEHFEKLIYDKYKKLNPVFISYQHLKKAYEEIALNLINNIGQEGKDLGKWIKSYSSCQPFSSDLYISLLNELKIAFRSISKVRLKNFISNRYGSTVDKKHNIINLKSLLFIIEVARKYRFKNTDILKEFVFGSHFFPIFTLAFCALSALSYLSLNSKVIDLTPPVGLLTTITISCIFAFIQNKRFELIVNKKCDIACSKLKNNIRLLTEQ